LDPDGVEAISMVYTGVMLHVQLFETSLGLLVLALDHDPHRKPNASAARQWKQAMQKSWTVFQADSASALKRKLEGRIPAELYEEIHALIKIRNTLAHRFLRDRLQRGVDGPAYQRGSNVELLSLLLRFSKADKRLAAHTESIRKTWPEVADMDAATREATEMLAQWTMYRRLPVELATQLKRKHDGLGNG
jgi:hypothetical protein